jgi:hypothetical protein
VQPEPGKGFHAERQQRFPDVKARELFALEEDHTTSGAREQRCGSAAGRSASYDRDIERAVMHRGLSLANYPDFGRDAGKMRNGTALQIPLPKDASTFAIENIIDMLSRRKHIVD